MRHAQRAQLLYADCTILDQRAFLVGSVAFILLENFLVLAGRLRLPLALPTLVQEDFLLSKIAWTLVYVEGAS